MSIGLYTKDQTQRMLANMGLNVPLPAKGNKMVIALSVDNPLPYMEVEKTDQKATYGGKLYQVKFLKGPALLS